MLEDFETQVTHQPRTAIVEAVKIVILKRAHGNDCPSCTLGMLLDELGFQEREFVAAGLLLPCIYATKTNIDWDALMTAIEIKRRGKLPLTCPPDLGGGLIVDDTRSGNERPYWLNESLKIE